MAEANVAGVMIKDGRRLRVLPRAASTPPGLHARVRAGRLAGRRLAGTPANLVPEEHDAIAWFTAESLTTLQLAHDSYLALLQTALKGWTPDVRCRPTLGNPSCSRTEEEDMSTTTTMWVWRSDLVETGSVEGFSVEAQDGSIGKIDETTNEVGGSYIVVDTGPWIFGKKVLLPAGMIERVDRTDERVFVGADEGADQERS